jgi:hypothetical protein
MFGLSVHRFGTTGGLRSAILLIAVALLAAPTSAQLVPNPYITGSGQYLYDNNTLTFNTSSVSQVVYGWSPYEFAGPEEPVLGATIEITGLDYTGELGGNYGFTDGTLTISASGHDYLTADIVDVELVPTDPDTAYVNEGLLGINLVNVIVSDPVPGMSRFVTDWNALGANYGAFGLTLENGDWGSVAPTLTSPARGAVSFALQPAMTPEPTSALFMLLGGGALLIRRRRV